MIIVFFDCLLKGVCSLNLVSLELFVCLCFCVPIVMLWTYDRYVCVGLHNELWKYNFVTSDRNNVVCEMVCIYFAEWTWFKGVQKSICLSACMSGCIIVCLTICLSVYLYVNRSICLFACLCLSICLYVCMPVCMYVCLYPLICLYAFVSVSLAPIGGAQLCRLCIGGDLGGAWGTGPSKIWGGGQPMHPSPNIPRSSDIGCVVKYELTKKICHEGMFCCEVFVKKRVTYVI